MTGIIYRITSPSNRIYIGQTTDTYSRFNRYQNLLCKGQRKLYNSFVKYGYDNHKIKTLHNDVPVVELDRLEEHYIRHYDCVRNGLNCLHKARGTRGIKYSEESRKRMSLAMTGKKASVETRRKMSLARSGKPGCRKGSKVTQETIVKIQATRELRKHTYTHGRKLNWEQVNQIRNLLINEKLKISEVAKRFKVSHECISGIKYNKHWIDTDYKNRVGDFCISTFKKLDESIVKEMKTDIKNGIKKWDIINKYQVKEHIYKDIRRGYTYKDVTI